MKMPIGDFYMWAKTIVDEMDRENKAIENQKGGR